MNLNYIYYQDQALPVSLGSMDKVITICAQLLITQHVRLKMRYTWVYIKTRNLHSENDAQPVDLGIPHFLTLVE